MAVPVGFRFQPTDEELLSHFLYNKVVAMMNNTPPPQEPLDIPEVDLFDKNQEPWEIWEKLEGPKLMDQDLYLYTKLKKANPKGSRIDRKVGKGTWSEGEPAKLVYVGETKNAIGRKRKFRYENKGNKDHHAGWYMDEYSLLADDGNSFLDCVICRLRPNDRSSSSGNKRKNTSSLCQESDDREKAKKPRINKRKARNVEEEQVEGAETSSVVVNIVPNNNNHNHNKLDDAEEVKGIEGNCDSGDPLLNMDIEQELRAMLDCDEEVNNVDYYNGTTTTPPALPDHHQYPHESQLVQPLQTDSGFAVDELVMMNMTNNNNGFDGEGGQYLMGYNVNHGGLFDVEQELMAMLPHYDDDHYLCENQLLQLPLMPTDHSGNLGADADADFGGAATLQMEAAATNNYCA